MEKLGLMNKAQADELFSREAVLLGEHVEGVPDYRIGELFHKLVCRMAGEMMGQGSYLQWGADYSQWSSADTAVPYFTRSGFRKIVAIHNYTELMTTRRLHDGAAIWDDIYLAQGAALAAREAAQSKRAENRAKVAERRKKLNEMLGADAPEGIRLSGPCGSLHREDDRLSASCSPE